MTRDPEQELREYREQWKLSNHELERVSAELQRSRKELISRTEQLQSEREGKAKQLQEARAEMKKATTALKEARDYFERRTQELQETIAQLTASEAQLSEARRTLDRAADAERRRISDGLHSGPVHKLSEALLSIEDFLNHLPENVDRSQFLSIQSTLEEALKMTDHAVHLLKPVELRRGLIEGLKALLYRMFPNRQVARFSGPKTNTDFGLDEADQITLYRFAHEALNNVQRHGRDSVSIELSISEKNNYLQLAIVNDLGESNSESAPTAPDSESREEGHGLHNMRAYAVLLNADMENTARQTVYEIRLRKRLSN